MVIREAVITPCVTQDEIGLRGSRAARNYQALFVHVIFRSTHPDKVALHRGTRILQHAAKFPAVVQDEEVDVELLLRTLVVSDLPGAVSVDNGLPCIDCRDYGTVETLRSGTFEKTIRIACTGSQQ
jgi:hypothetical protein